MMYLFDDENNASVLRDCSDWNDAENTAKRENLTLVGEFVMWVDAETLEKTYIN